MSAISSRYLIRNSALNFGGQVVPMLVAFFAIPVVIRQVGVEQFALLSLAWTMLGYFSLFDFGLGRATTKQVAELVADGQHRQASTAIAVSTVINVGLGALFAGIFAVLSPFLVREVFRIPDELKNEASRMMTVLAVSVPLITVGGTFRCALEAIQRFKVVNAVKAPFNALLFLIPVIGFSFSLRLSSVVGLIVLSRLASALAYLYFLLKEFSFSTLRQGELLRTGTFLVRYGGWVSVSNALNPVLNYAERFIIPGVISIGALTYYTAPYEMISRMAVLPFSFAITLFPQFSALAKGDVRETPHDLFVIPTKFILGILVPITGLIIFFPREILDIWLGGDFSSRSSIVLQLLALAFLFNALAYVPLVAVQGLGYPELKAQLDIALTVLFLGASWVFTRSAGLNGAALAKLIVFIIDAIALLWFSKTILKVTVAEFLPKSFRLLGLSSAAILLLGMALESLQTQWYVRAAMYCGVTTIYIVLFWKRSLSADERCAVQGLISHSWEKSATA